MAASPGYIAYVVEQLEAFGRVTVKRMFGGAGLYVDAVMFGLVSSDDVFYLKVDDENRPRFEDRGCTAFAPMQGKTVMPYMTVPEDVIEDSAELADWARNALAAAARKKSSER